MKLSISDGKAIMGKAAATRGAQWIRAAQKKNAGGLVSIVVATGASQFEMLAELVKAPHIDWSKITAFHLDEFVGMAITHPASFRKYLWERFHSRLPLPLAAFHYIDAERDAPAECRRLNGLIPDPTIDVAFIGIGENGHLAFNDPPADFETEEPYLVVTLDEACRRQQLGEGWFESLSDVPRQAISMGIRQILRAQEIIAVVPDARKAKAVAACCEGDISPLAPASILRTHPNTTIYLDKSSAALLSAAMPIVLQH